MYIGVFSSRSTAASASFRCRSNSDEGKVGCSRTSENKSTDSTRLLFSVESLMTLWSKFVSDRSSDPRLLNRSSIYEPERVVVAASISLRVILATPGKSHGSAAEPASKLIHKFTSGVSCRSNSATFRPLDRVILRRDGILTLEGGSNGGALSASVCLPDFPKPKGTTLRTYTPSESHFRAAVLSSSAVALRTRSTASPTAPSPRPNNTLCANRSDLLPSPPSRSMFL